MSGGAESKLAVLVDGAPLPEEEAKALWKAFSEHMEAHRGDMAGFAAQKGWVSVSPEYRQGKAVLVARTTTSTLIASAPARLAPLIASAPPRLAPLIASAPPRLAPLIASAPPRKKKPRPAKKHG